MNKSPNIEEDQVVASLSLVRNHVENQENENELNKVVSSAVPIVPSPPTVEQSVDVNNVSVLEQMDLDVRSDQGGLTTLVNIHVQQCHDPLPALKKPKTFVRINRNQVSEGKEESSIPIPVSNPVIPSHEHSHPPAPQLCQIRIFIRVNERVIQTQSIVRVGVDPKFLHLGFQIGIGRFIPNGPLPQEVRAVQKHPTDFETRILRPDPNCHVVRDVGAGAVPSQVNAPEIGEFGEPGLGAVQ
ncbi:response regulator [Striga asiatica]|uniref:Response regulator n=1 Tax=Striga asiatica TaxID=4170 RepID=A0A5A7QZL0_STRAF|nr:response regulator [Striga asiatica]